MQISPWTHLIFLTGCIAPVQAAPLADRMDRCGYTEYCAGTEYNVTLVDTYICGDWRLGPVKLPAMPPLEPLLETYDRFGGLCPGEFLELWWNATASPRPGWNYPEQDGFSLDYTNDQQKGRPIYGNLTLPNNTLIDRFGKETGRFFSPAAAPYMQRALPPSNLDAPQDDPKYPYNYHVYRLLQPLSVVAGPIAPWFGQAGQGVQYLARESARELLDRGILEELDLGAVWAENNTASCYK